MGLSPIQFSPNVGLATIITACQPTEGAAHQTSAPARRWEGCGGRKGDLRGAWRRVPAVDRAATQLWLWCVRAWMHLAGVSPPSVV